MSHKQLTQKSNVISTTGEDFENLIGKTKMKCWKMFNFVPESA